MRSLATAANLKFLLLAVFILTALVGFGQQYRIVYKPSPGEATLSSVQLDSLFASRMEADGYLAQLPVTLRNQGYLAASVDEVRLDSLQGEVKLFLGRKYEWTMLETESKDQELLQSIRWPRHSKLRFEEIQQWQRKVLDYLEDRGYPFGKVYLDSFHLQENSIQALLRIEEGPLYKIDSIRVYGDVNVKNEFLQQYLDIYNGSLYNKSKLAAISRKMAGIPYLQEERPSDLTMLGTGSVLNLYLKPRRNSQVNALIGFLPNSNVSPGENKFLLTVDANILLRNALGGGETFGLVWQQLQRQSPRLNLLYEQPFLFKSPFGLNFMLDMYKRDSTFLNINMNLGTNYRFDEKQSASLFLTKRQSIVNGINTGSIIASRRLPREADVNSLNLGLGYSFTSTDYRFNPSRGSEFNVVSSAGTKKIKKNNQVLELKDPADPGFDFERLYDTVRLKAYQFRVTASAAHFIPLGGQSTLKLGLQGGLYQSANYFRNELFQIGGFRLLRGFDEESQFVSQYAVGTVEYRLRTDMNSYFFGFIDGGFGKHLLEAVKSHQYISGGLGLSLEMKAGLISMAVALGKRDDLEFNLRQPKVHIGFVSYF